MTEERYVMGTFMQAYLRITSRHLWRQLVANMTMLVLCVLCTVGVMIPTSAEDLFTKTATVSDGAHTESFFFSADSLEALFNSVYSAANTILDTTSIFNGNTAAINETTGIYGNTVVVSYALNSNIITLNVPSLGITRTFAGATRTDSMELLVDFLDSNESDILARMLQKMVEISPVDPVAGNPSSLQGIMSENTFGIGTGIGEISGSGGATSIKTTNLGRQPNIFEAGGDIGIVDSGGFRSYVLTLPLRYSFYLDNPEYALTVDAPLTYIDTEGAQIWTGSLGLSFRMPVLKNWYITPSIRSGITESGDLGTSAFMHSASVTSLYSIYSGDFKINIGNGVGHYYTTSEISAGNISTDYTLNNTALKNGVSIEAPLNFTILGRPTSWQAYIIDTQMFGDKLYLEHYDEIGVLMGTRQNMDSQSWDAFRMGLSFTFGDDYKALKANFNYRF